jgi:hypothetical protein
MDAFNEYSMSKNGNSMLDLTYSNRAGTNYITFDFLTRTMVARTGSSESGLTVTPFSQLDREMLVAARDKLVDLGGNPPDLPAEAPSTPANNRKFQP